MLAEQLQKLATRIHRFEALIAQVFEQHSEAHLFRHLPGAGPALAPRLLVAFGTQRDRCPVAANFQRFSGVAPVTEKSGHRKWVHWRWSAPRFLRQSLVEWANQSIYHSTWAGAYYRQQKNRGKRHQAILRSLACKWIRILWRCWMDHTPYDEARYLKHLATKNPSLVKLAYEKAN